jgi:hypothetical protein
VVVGHRFPAGRISGTVSSPLSTISSSSR